MSEGVETEFATAVLLVVEVVFTEQLVATFLQTALAPVLGPEKGVGGMRWYRITLNSGERGGRWGDGLLGKEPSLVDLVEALPTGGGEGGGKIGDSEGLGLEGGGGETNAEALEAAGTPFGFVFKTLDLLEPGLMVVITVYPGDVEAVGMTLALILADIVFFAGVDVGVKVKDSGTDIVLEHPLHDGRGAGSTTGVEKNFVESFGNDDIVLMPFHAAKVRKS